MEKQNYKKPQLIKYSKLKNVTMQGITCVQGFNPNSCGEDCAMFS